MIASLDALRLGRVREALRIARELGRIERDLVVKNRNLIIDRHGVAYRFEVYDERGELLFGGPLQFPIAVTSGVDAVVISIARD